MAPGDALSPRPIRRRPPGDRDPRRCHHFRAAPLVPAGAEAAWSIASVDATTNSGWCTSLRLGRTPEIPTSPLMLPRVAYWSAGVGFRYAEFDGASWWVEPAGPASGKAARPELALLITGVTPLALDPDGEPWIAQATLNQNDQGRGPITVRHRSQTVWSSEGLGTANGAPSIEVDASGAVHVLFPSPDGLVYARRAASGGWSSEFVAPASSFGELVLDPAGRVHVASISFGVLPRSVVLARRTDAGGWDRQVADSTSNASGIALAFNGAGDPRIVFQSSDGTASRLMFAERRADTGWRSEPITPAGVSSSEWDLAVAPGDVPHVAFRDPGPNTLRSARRQAGTWAFETVDGLSGAGEHPSIQVDATDRPVVAYKRGYAEGVGCATGTAVVVGVGDGAPSQDPRGLQLLAWGPNPSRAGAALWMTVSSPADDRVRIEAHDASGRSAGTSPTFAIGPGPSRLAWTPPGRVRSGLLFLRVVSERGAAASARFVVLD